MIVGFALSGSWAPATRRKPQGGGCIFYRTPQRRTVPSSDPDASLLPSGEKETLTTAPVCPLKVRKLRAVATFHNLIVSSADPDASRLPSDEKEILNTQPIAQAQVISEVYVAHSSAADALDDLIALQ